MEFIHQYFYPDSNGTRLMQKVPGTDDIIHWHLTHARDILEFDRTLRGGRYTSAQSVPAGYNDFVDAFNRDQDCPFKLCRFEPSRRKGYSRAHGPAPPIDRITPVAVDRSVQRQLATGTRAIQFLGEREIMRFDQRDHARAQRLERKRTRDDRLLYDMMAARRSRAEHSGSEDFPSDHGDKDGRKKKVRRDEQGAQDEALTDDRKGKEVRKEKGTKGKGKKGKGKREAEKSTGGDHPMELDDDGDRDADGDTDISVDSHGLGRFKSPAVTLTSANADASTTAVPSPASA